MPLGKYYLVETATIEGRQGSSSRNYDVLGRELFTPDEVRKAMIVGVPENKILEYFYPDVEVEEMRQVREDFEKASA